MTKRLAAKDDAIKAIWRAIHPELGPREHMQLDTSHHYSDGTIDVRLSYFRETPTGRFDRASYRTHAVNVDIDRIARASRRPSLCVDEIIGHVEYLIAVVRPPPKPRGFRILSKRVVIAPAPRHRSRLRSRP